MNRKQGILAISPMVVLMVFIILFTIHSVGQTGDKSSDTNLSLTVAFLFASVYAIITSRGFSLKQRIEAYSRGAGASNLMLMLWIYVLAGAFAASAKQMGSIDATVSLTLAFLPASMILPGLFVAACFISLAIGTSVGTVVALVPIAAGLAQQTGSEIPLFTAAIVGGAYFGDNLSFISDTTVVATQTQQCKMSDKFRVNVMIVAPAALVILVVYAFMGAGMETPTQKESIDFVKVIPYLAVLVIAICGINVMAVLTIGLALCGIIGVADGSYDIYGWFGAMGNGILGMGELIIIAMMAGGMLEIVRKNGGIDYIIYLITRHVSTRRGAELSIAALVSLVNLCTANNTVAILTVGDIAKKIGDRFGVDRRKAASILDTFSCTVQGLIPYGVQMLLAAGLAEIGPMQILPNLYYPMAIGICSLLAIIFRFPKRYS
ncbi:MAG: Na+/H+ antiporter NhaC family protein [Prevotella sp.]|nr:Na+/H+ antiporter NhaC family protein [Prevotella sp.]